jgi:hypothetical protein
LEAILSKTSIGPLRKCTATSYSFRRGPWTFFSMLTILKFYNDPNKRHLENYTVDQFEINYDNWTNSMKVFNVDVASIGSAILKVTIYN